MGNGYAGSIHDPATYYSFNSRRTTGSTTVFAQNLVTSFFDLSLNGTTDNVDVKKFGQSSLSNTNSLAQRTSQTSFALSSSGFTVAFWLRAGATNGHLFGLSVLNNNNLVVGLQTVQVAASQFRLDLLTDRANNTIPHITIIQNLTFSVNTWYHLAVSLVGLQCVLYVDGVLAHTIALTEAVNSATVRNRFNLLSVNGRSPPCTGHMDDFRYYARVLTDADIRTLYHYTPPTVLSTYLWLDASDANTLYLDAGGGGLTTDGGVLRCWKGKTGGSLQTQSTTGIQQNGGAGFTYSATGMGGTRPAVLCNGIQNYRLANNSLLLPMTGDASSVFFVMQNNQSPNSGAFLTYGTDVRKWWVADSALRAGRNTTTPMVSDSTSTLINVPTLVACTMPSNGIAATTRNGAFFTPTSAASFNWTGTSPTSTVSIFSNFSNSEKCNSRLSEVLIVASALTDDVRQRVEGYLAQKWGVALAADHPWATADPDIGFM